MSFQCPYCGASYTGQEPNCARCGAPRPAAYAQPAPGLVGVGFTTPPPRPQRRSRTFCGLVVLIIPVVIVISVVVAMLAAFGVFNSSADSGLPNTTGPGWWKATAPGLGTFQFKLNNDQTSITEFVFQIPKISCPDITYSVTSEDIRTSEGWAVKQGQFSADVELENDPEIIDVEVSGTIVSAGQQASGDWVFDGEVGTSCQGSWTGVPST
jgi:hypothetical protein